MFQWLTRLFGYDPRGPILVYIIVLVVAFIARIIVAKNIAFRGDLVLIAKGYDAGKINLRNMATWICIFLGIILCYVIVFWYVGTFPTVEATNDLFQYEEDEPEEEPDDPN